MSKRKFCYNGKRPTKRMKKGPKPTTNKQEKRRIYRKITYGVEE